MSAATLSSLPTPSTIALVPDALQQFLNMIGEQRDLNLRISEDLHNLKFDLETRWRIANSEGRSSSTMLYEILAYGWEEWRRITA